MSAVKNLRAMFEQKGETSPPERGRSPGIPLGSESPRPLSKVRTSFIAIEKEGRIGLQREGSQDSITGFRKLSGDSNVTTPITGNEKSNPFETLTRSPAKMNLQTQPIFESPRPVPETKDTGSPVKEAKDAKQATAPVSGTPSPTPGTKDTLAKEDPAGATQERDPASIVSGRGGGEEEQDTTAKEAPKPAAVKPTARTTKPAPKPLSLPPVSKPALKPEKSPTLHKAQKSPSMTPVQKSAVKKTPEKKAQAAEKPSTPRTPATATSKSAAPSSIKKPPPLQASPASTGFVKPKPKSPTRPVKLPAGLTTHTASSGSKVSAPRQSLSRASGDSLPRPASRASASASTPSHKPAAAPGHKVTPTTAAAKHLKRQNSTIHRTTTTPRPSLGPPPKKTDKDHTPARKEKEVDQGFLARMMRPTQASANKVADKVHQQHLPHVSPSASKAAEKVQPQHQQHRSPPRKAVSPPAAGVKAPAPSEAEAEPELESKDDAAVAALLRLPAAVVVVDASKQAEAEIKAAAVSRLAKVRELAKEAQKMAADEERAKTGAAEETKTTASEQPKTSAAEQPAKTVAAEEPKSAATEKPETAASEEPKTAMPEGPKKATLDEFVKLNTEPKAGACFRSPTGSMSVRPRSESSEAHVAAELQRGEDEEVVPESISESAAAVPRPLLEEEEEKVGEPAREAEPEPTAAVDAPVAVKDVNVPEAPESKNEVFTTPQENAIPGSAAES